MNLQPVTQESNGQTPLTLRIEDIKRPLARIIQIQEAYQNPKLGTISDYSVKAAREVILLNAQKIEQVIEDILEIEREKLRQKSVPRIFHILKEQGLSAQIKPNISQVDTAWLKEIETYVEANMSSGDIRLCDIAYEVAVSERQLHRRINKLLGMTPNQYLRKLRLHKAKQLLEERRYNTIQEVAREVGFQDAHYFSKRFTAIYNYSPCNYFK